MQSMIIGAITMIGTLWIMGSLYIFNPPRHYLESDLTFFSGEIKSVGNVNQRKGFATLELAIKGQPLVFRCFDGPYPGSFDRAVLSTLAEGRQARIGVVTTALQTHRTDLASGVNFYPFVSLELNGRPALTVQNYNNWSKRNQALGKWLLPFFCCAGVYLLYAGLEARKAGRPFV